MVNRVRIFIFIIVVLWGITLQAQDDHTLWYDKPARDWMEAVPLGNGRLGAMPDGQIFSENIILNDITLWSGSKQDANREGAAEHLPEIRKLIFEGKNEEAEALVNRYFVSKGAGSGLGQGADVPYGSYQNLGNLSLLYEYDQDSSKTTLQNYRRNLDLDKAIATTEFTVGGVNYKREYFTSFSSDAIIIRLTADQPGKISFNASLNRAERYQTEVSGKELMMYGRLNDGTPRQNGMRYLTRLRVQHSGGKLKTGQEMLHLKKADTATIYLTSATDFRGYPYRKKTEKTMDSVINTPYQEERKAHITNFQKLFHKAQLHLKNPNAKQAKLPTNERLWAYKTNPTDNDLPALYFNYGRYLLISSTRPGLLPPNLQGLWANTINTPWNGDYHFNINYQMNHWPLDVTNLPELNEPFFTLIKGLIEPGEKTAKVYYDGKGWVAHVITNVWGYTAPGESASWGATNSGSGWLSNLLWRHYAFTLDKDYLEKIYPVIKGSAEFYLSTLVKDPETEQLMTAPSNSPENAFQLPNGKIAHIDAGPTIDNQIIRELFEHVIKASEILQKDKHFRKELAAATESLLPNQIDSNGRLMEWRKPYKEVEVHHRHVSPLWGLYPGNEISVADTPELAEAAKKLLKRRGDISTGWSLAWKINLWARLKDGNHALKLIGDLLRPARQKDPKAPDGSGSYPNLLDAHPPFQIDGNFGGAAGIAEMLIQSHEEAMEFLPALPDQWSAGSFANLRVRGGGIVSASWDNKRLNEATLKATHSHVFKILLTDKQKKSLNPIDKRFSPALQGNILQVNLKEGEEVRFEWDA